MQFQVPQFIETEDKIVGPLTLRQFIYVGVGAGITALLYFMLQLWIWVILAFIVMGIAIAISFIKVEGRPFANVILSAFHYYWRPQTYIWKPEQPALPKAKKEAPVKKPDVGTLQKLAAGMALHKSWQHVQTGEKMSDKQFTERKMSARYQILQRISGERRAAKRVDYR